VELRILARWNALSFDASLHAAHFADVVFGEGLLVDEPIGQVAEPRAQLGVAGNEPGPGDRLPFPGEAPLLVVRREPADRPGQWTVVALGPQPGVDAERLAFCGGRADLLDELRRDVFRLAERVGTVAVVDEHHVDVGGVRQLGTAEAAHADHCERHR
jgi:hypothetical protein